MGDDKLLQTAEAKQAIKVYPSIKI